MVMFLLSSCVDTQSLRSMATAGVLSLLLSMHTGKRNPTATTSAQNQHTCKSIHRHSISSTGPITSSVLNFKFPQRMILVLPFSHFSTATVFKWRHFGNSHQSELYCESIQQEKTPSLPAGLPLKPFTHNCMGDGRTAIQTIGTFNSGPIR